MGISSRNNLGEVRNVRENCITDLMRSWELSRLWDVSVERGSWRGFANTRPEPWTQDRPRHLPSKRDLIEALEGKQLERQLI